MKTFSGRVISLILMFVFLLCLSRHDPAYSAETSHSGREALLEKFYLVEKTSQNTLPGLKAYIDSYVERNISGVDIYGVLGYPFELVENEFMSPANWCDIVILHPNLKACTYQGRDDDRRLILFNADKAEQTLAEASPIEFRWKMTLQPDYFDILLSASEGPYSTRDHRFSLEAVPIDGHRTVVHLSYSYTYGGLASIFMKSYFAIFSRGKVGFSTKGTDSRHNPEYVTGVRGLNERNVVRYYLAILAHMETRQLRAEQRPEKSIGRWYDLASQYKKQLAPGEKKDYIARKKLDLQNQRQLQDAAGKLLN